VRRSRRSCVPERTATRSNWSQARRASRPGRPACSTTRLPDRRACSAADSSGARPRRSFRTKSLRPPSLYAPSKKSGQGMGDINLTGVPKAYDRWAPVYDLVFGKVFDEGRRSTIAEADRIGGRVLDVGVGTGLSLSDYSRSTKLCGVDISEGMLRKARQRVR